MFYITTITITVYIIITEPSLGGARSKHERSIRGEHLIAIGIGIVIVIGTGIVIVIVVVIVIGIGTVIVIVIVIRGEHPSRDWHTFAHYALAMVQ